MNDQEIKLSTAQERGLKLIVNRIVEKDSTWVDVTDIDPRVRNNLVKHHFIDLMENDDETHARLTTAGARYLGMEHPDEVIFFAALAPTTEPELVLADPSLPCIVEGCDQPRMVTPNGVTLTTCPDHRASPDIKPFANGDKTADTARPKPPIIKPDPENPWPQVMDTLKAQQPEKPQRPCTDCDHARVLELIRVMYPEVDSAVDILQRAEEARRLLDASRTKD